MKRLQETLQGRHYIRWLLVIAVVFISLIALYGQLNRYLEKKNNENILSSETQKLVGEDYTKVRDHYLLSIKSDPTKAIEMFRADIEQHDEVANSCHAIAHEMGHKTYELLGYAEATKYLDEVCNGGFIHGVIESHFSNLEDIELAMETTCVELNESMFMEWQCYHGLGHGVMFFTNNDLPRAVELCRGIESIDGQDSCINGVFMENFGVDGLTHNSQFVDANDPFYPCSLQSDENKPACYIYSASYYLGLNNLDYISALEWCESSSEYSIMCAYGVGSETVKQNINDIKFAEAICYAGPTLLADECMEGVAALYSFHHGGVTELTIECGFLDSGRSVCERAAKELIPFFSTIDKSEA